MNKSELELKRDDIRSKIKLLSKELTETEVLIESFNWPFERMDLITDGENIVYFSGVEEDTYGGSAFGWKIKKDGSPYARKTRLYNWYDREWKLIKE